MHAARGKEGLSIFGLSFRRFPDAVLARRQFRRTGIVNLTRSPLGSVLMRQWLIRPSLEINVIEERHETVAHLLRPENGLSNIPRTDRFVVRADDLRVRDVSVAAADAIRSHLKSVKNANKALLALLSGRGKLREWSNLYAVSASEYPLRSTMRSS